MKSARTTSASPNSSSVESRRPSRVQAAALPKGLIGLGFMFGPIGGFDEAGNLAGVLDIEWHCETAKANGAAAHITRGSKASTAAH